MNISSLHELRQGISHLFYPQLCEGCNKPLVGKEWVLCVGCGMEVPETGYHNIKDNDTALRLAGRIPFEYATSMAYFTGEGLLQHLLHELKYNNRAEIGTYLGERFGETLSVTDWISTVNVIIPVPLHKSRYAIRPYNQSMLVAEAMGKVLGIPATDSVLKRVRQTESQTRKGRAERADNMEDAFEVVEKGEIVGKHVLIVDDVLTTGSTIEACARALLAEEKVKISVATIGIAVS